MKSKLLIFIFALTASNLSRSAEECAHSERIIGEIFITVKPPHKFIEENFGSSWLNFMYKPTKQSTIKKYLTFKQGDVVNIDNIEETIRKLRRARFIWDLSYELIQNTHCTFDIIITIYDTFPFRPKLSFSQKNGASKSTIGISNSNLLGSGTRLQFEFKQEKLRDQKILKYNNPNFSEEHYLFSAAYSDNTDGKELFFRFGNPFYTLDSESSFDMSLNQFSGLLQLYNNSTVQFLTDYSTEESALIFGIGKGEGYGFSRSRLFLYSSHDKGTYLNLPLRDRNLISIGTRYELFDTNFIEVQNIRSMTKFEDYNQGLMLSFDIAAAYDQVSNIWGTNVGFKLTKNSVFNDRTLLLSSASYRTQEFGNHLDSSRLAGSFELNHFLSNFQQSWNVKLQFDTFSNPTPENLIMMDDEFSIRGFPFGYRLGDSMASINIEKRWFNVARFFDSFDVAAVVFFDAGIISIDNSDVSNQQQTSLKSFGLGFRISPTKLAKNAIIHIDLAFPEANDLDQNYQFNIFAKSHF